MTMTTEAGVEHSEIRTPGIEGVTSEACNIRPAGHNPARGTGLRGPHILGQVSHHF